MFKRSKGFTFIELVVVMLILGIIMSITVPRLIKLEGIHLKSQARRLAVLFPYLYSEAVTTGRSYRVCFDIDKRTYWVEKADAAGQFAKFANVLTRKERLLEGIEFVDIITPEGVKISEGKVFTYFYPHGFTDNLTIHIRNEQKNTLTLLVNCFTANVDIQQGYAESEEYAI